MQKEELFSPFKTPQGGRSLAPTRSRSPEAARRGRSFGDAEKWCRFVMRARVDGTLLCRRFPSLSLCLGSLSCCGCQPSCVCALLSSFSVFACRREGRARRLLASRRRNDETASASASKAGTGVWRSATGQQRVPLSPFHSGSTIDTPQRSIFTSAKPQINNTSARTLLSRRRRKPATLSPAPPPRLSPIASARD